MKVGWIGLGRIGKQMALRTAAAGHTLTGHARSPEKHGDLAASGVALTTSLVEAVEGADLVCVNVYDETQLRDALIDDGGLMAMKTDAILVIHSTVGPAIIHEIASIRRDIRVLDAQFSGTDRNAAEGTVALMVGGEPHDLEAARPVLESYADYVQHMGPLGAGATTKLVNNALFGAQMLLAHDALRVLKSGGIDQDTALGMIGRSSGQSFAIQQFGFGRDPWERLMAVWPYIQKDVSVARDAAAHSGLDLGMLDIATRPYLKATP